LLSEIQISPISYVEEKSSFEEAFFQSSHIFLDSLFTALSYFELGLFSGLSFGPRDVMDVLQVATQVTTLCKVLTTDVTLVRSLHSVLSEVITQVATLSENGFTAFILASEV
jgi:hypothetical protein